MIITLDTETTGFDTRKFECGCVVLQDGKEFTFFDKEQMFMFLINKIEKEAKRGHNTYIYAHNHAYDWYAYARGNWDYKGLEYVGISPLFMVKYGKGTFLDSYGIFKMPLAKLGEMIKDEKVKINEEMLRKENLTAEELEKKAEYCMQDARILMKALLKLKNEMNKMGYKPKKMVTAGQIAISVFMTYIKKKGYWYQMCDEKDVRRIRKSRFEDMVRVALRGARCEAFQKGKFDKITYIDVNSLYPYIMSTMDFPNLRTEKFSRVFHKEDLDRIGLIKCSIKSPKREMGMIPIRYNKQLHFPKEEVEMTSVWVIKEVKDAIEKGYQISDVEWTITYDKGDNPFTKFVNDLYQVKSTSKDDAIKLATKLMLNSLFGKFAQKRGMRESKFIERRELSEYQQQGWEFKGVLETKYFISREMNPITRYFVNPIISVLITSGARQFLYNNLIKIDKEDLLYCDTDSIIMKNFKKYEKVFPVSNKLGEWKIVCDNERIDIRGTKQYMIGEDVKVSGVPKIDSKSEDFRTGTLHTRRMISMMSAGDVNMAGTFTKFDMVLGESEKELPKEVKEIVDMGDFR